MKKHPYVVYISLCIVILFPLISVFFGVYNKQFKPGEDIVLLFDLIKNIAAFLALLSVGFNFLYTWNADKCIQISGWWIFWAGVFYFIFSCGLYYGLKLPLNPDQYRLVYNSLLEIQSILLSFLAGISGIYVNGYYYRKYKRKENDK